MFATTRSPLIFALVVVLAGVAMPAGAQVHQGAITVTGGGSVHSDLAPGLPTSALFKPGWITGLQLEGWMGSGRVGLRLNSLFTQRRLERTGYYNYNVVLSDLDLLVRLRSPRPGTAFMPFLAVGAGATHYAGVAGTQPIADGAYGDPVFRAHLTAALGVDLMASRRSGVRIEFGDQVVLPSIGQSPDASGLPRVHNMMLTMGVQLRMGTLGRGPVRMADVAPAPSEPAAQPEVARPEPDAGAGDPQRLQAQLAEKEREVARLRARTDSLERLLAAEDESLAAPVSEPVTPAAHAADNGAGERRYTVQIGSFVEAATADRWVERLERRGLPVWRSDVEIEGERVSRVRVGAVPSEAEAHTLADALRRDYGWPVWVDRVQDDDAVPSDAVEETRSVLYRL